MDLAGNSSYKIEEVEMVIYEWRGLMPAMTELLNFCQYGTNVTVRPGAMFKNYTSME
jgi:hypothetical protein